jgi:hypothetical protein
MKFKIIDIVGLIAGISGVVLTFIFFDWKLFLVLFLLTFGNNISQRIK